MKCMHECGGGGAGRGACMHAIAMQCMQRDHTKPSGRATHCAWYTTRKACGVCVRSACIFFACVWLIRAFTRNSPQAPHLAPRSHASRTHDRGYHSRVHACCERGVPAAAGGRARRLAQHPCCHRSASGFSPLSPPNARELASYQRCAGRWFEGNSSFEEGRPLICDQVCGGGGLLYGPGPAAAARRAKVCMRRGIEEKEQAAREWSSKPLGGFEMSEI